MLKFYSCILNVIQILDNYFAIGCIRSIKASSYVDHSQLEACVMNAFGCLGFFDVGGFFPSIFFVNLFGLVISIVGY
jgi:hypothetical protein